MIGRLNWFLLLISLFLSSFICASSEDTKEPVLFATSTIKPWGMEIDGEMSGLLIDSIEEIHKKTAIPYLNNFRPYTRVLQEIVSGQADFAITFRSPDVDKKAILVGDIAQTNVVVITRANFHQEVESLESLKGFKIGHIRGSKYGPRFDQARHFTRIPINSIEQGLGMLIRGRIDAMAAVDHTIYWGLNALGIQADEVSELTRIPGPVLSLYLSRKSEHIALLSLYQTAVNELKTDGTFERIYGNPSRWLLK